MIMGLLQHSEAAISPQRRRDAEISAEKIKPESTEGAEVAEQAGGDRRVEVRLISSSSHLHRYRLGHKTSKRKRVIVTGRNLDDVCRLLNLQR
jgi:hypothetical protein